MQAKHQSELFAFGMAFYAIVTFLSLDMYLPALPTITRELGFTQDMAQYTVTLWFLGSASTQLILAPLADYYGRKYTFIIGIVVFIIASLCCANATNYYVLLLSRFFQGATVCSTMVAGYATIHAIFSGKRVIQVMAVLSSITILAPALGPLFGAYVILHFSWHMIFYILAVLAVVALIWHICFMPATKHQNASLEFAAIFQDYASIVTNRQFIQLVCASCLLTSAFFMWVVESPFIIITHLKLGEVLFGQIQIPIFTGFIIGGQITRYCVKQHEPEKLVCIGMLTALLGVIGFMMSAYCGLGIVFCVMALTVLAIGASMTFGPMSRFAIESSNAPMASRVAIQSLGTSLCGVLASGVVTYINDMTFFDIAIPMLCAVALACILFFTAKLPKVAA